MNQDPHPPDALDRAFSDYFQGQMPRPWPPAPAVAATPARGRAADPSRRARWTLAASVALLAGTGWFVSGGPPPGGRSVPKSGPAAVTDPFAGSTATMPDALKGGAGKAESAAQGLAPEPIELP
jgi:hypothetical protein